MFDLKRETNIAAGGRSSKVAKMLLIKRLKTKKPADGSGLWFA
jgi:hypothetical protein